MLVSGSVGRRAKKAITLCASAALLALVAFIFISYGFDATVKCEVNNYVLLRQTSSVISEIALTNGCGF
jgi:hypothetical protein